MDNNDILQLAMRHTARLLDAQRAMDPGSPEAAPTIRAYLSAMGAFRQIIGEPGDTASVPRFAPAPAAERHMLTFTHWKGHIVTKNVTLEPGTRNTWTDGTTLWHVPLSGVVYHAGRIIKGERRYSSPVKVGHNGSVGAA